MATANQIPYISMHNTISAKDEQHILGYELRPQKQHFFKLFRGHCRCFKVGIQNATGDVRSASCHNPKHGAIHPSLKDGTLRNMSRIRNSSAPENDIILQSYDSDSDDSEEEKAKKTGEEMVELMIMTPGTHQHPTATNQEASHTESESDTESDTAPKPTDESIPQLSETKGRFSEGMFLTISLFLLLLLFFLLVDSYIWRIIRRPLSSLFLTLPFLLSTALSAYAGLLALPVLRKLKTGQILREEGPSLHLSKAGTPTLGGLWFVPVGLMVARFAVGGGGGAGVAEMEGAVAVTLAFLGIGFLDDVLVLWRGKNDGLPGKIKMVLQTLVGAAFCVWLDSAPLHSPYNMKSLVPLPPPFGLWHLGLLYLPLTVFTFAAMSNGVNLTDGLDGLGAGTCAAAFLGMGIAVMPVYPALGIFGASMSGACVGFLVHNRHKADVFMGDSGSLALGGALAAMAAISGMFLPLLVASGWFVGEVVSVLGQVGYYKITKRIHGQGRRWLKMAPFHHHLELIGVREPTIIAIAYVVAFILAIVAAYVGLISA